MKQKNKRTKRNGVIAVGLAAALAIGGAFAFMSDHDNAINKFNFTSEDGDSSIDIQLSETNWVEENGKDILYGTPVAKNPVATNVGTNDMYAFATVILPAKGVTVQNAKGEIVDVTNTPISDLAAAGIQRVIANNVSSADKVTEGDETEILGVFKDAALENEYEFGEVIPFAEGAENSNTIYFKLNADAPVDSFPADAVTAYTADGEVAGTGDTVAYKVLADTVDTNNFTSNILGHQFMLKLEDNGSGDIAIRELYALETGTGVTKDDVRGVDRTINNTVNNPNTPENEGAWVEADDADVDNGGTDKLDDASTGLSVSGKNQVYGRYNYNKPVAANESAGTEAKAGWIEITDKLDNETIYIDGAGRVYSAHVFYYSAPLAAGESTVSVFDAVELINVADGQIMEEDDMNIYVETYGVQVNGLGDALGETDAASVEGGKIIWDVMANTTDQNGFDIFGVVKDTQDDFVANLLDATTNGGVQTVDNDYTPVA